MIGILGTNPDSWRLKELVSSLKEMDVPHQALFPWLFSLQQEGDQLEVRYASALIGEELNFDLIYVISLGLELLPEALFKLRLLRIMESLGTRIVNSVSTIETCRNKVDMTLTLSSRGIPMPETFVTESVHLAAEYISSNKPCVIKPITGLQGRGIILIPEGMSQGDIVDYLSWFQGRYGRDVIYVQKYVEHPSYDIRVLVVGDQVAAKMRRFSPESWKTNISAGAQPQPSDDDVDDLALQAARAVGGEVVGVDILPSVSGEYYVIEVNAFPGWRGLQEVSEERIAGAVVEYLSSLS